MDHLGFFYTIPSVVSLFSTISLTGSCLIALFHMLVQWLWHTDFPNLVLVIVQVTNCPMSNDWVMFNDWSNFTMTMPESFGHNKEQLLAMSIDYELTLKIHLLGIVG
jgi:hypothetical protein